MKWSCPSQIKELFEIFDFPIDSEEIKKKLDEAKKLFKIGQTVIIKETGSIGRIHSFNDKLIGFERQLRPLKVEIIDSTNKYKTLFGLPFGEQNGNIKAFRIDEVTC